MRPAGRFRRNARGGRPAGFVYAVAAVLLLCRISQGQDSRARSLIGVAAGAQLHKAAEANRVSEVKRLLAGGADPNTRHWERRRQGDDGATPLHTAAQYGRTEIAAVLLGYGAEVNARRKTPEDDPGTTPLHLAAASGSTNMAALLIEAGAAVAAGTTSGTPLHYAARHGQADMAVFLLAKGAAYAATDPRGYTPLHVARDARTAEILIASGANVNARAARDGRTPLHVAAHEGSLEAVRVLLEHGADTAARDAQGRSAVLVATQRGHPKVAALIRESWRVKTKPR